MEAQSTRTVRWPGAESGPTPWEDACWPSLDVENRFAGLWEARARWLAGRGSREAMHAIATAFGLTTPLLEDRNRPDWGHEPVSLDDLIRITTDIWPAAGMDAPDVVLGARSVFADPLARQVAVAGCAFVWSEDWPQSCFHGWCRGKPLPSAALRARVRAVGLAPWALWRVSGRDGDRVILADHSGLGDFYQADTPLTVIGERPTGEGLAARVTRTREGWQAHCAIDVPVLPLREQVEQWLEEETWFARTVQPGITREALLRKRATLVCRALSQPLTTVV